MSMFRGIFGKGSAKADGRRQERRPSMVTSEEPAPRLDMAADDSLLALSRELSALKQTQVPQGAKDRGWASLQRELERRPVRPAATAGAKGSAGAARPPRRGDSRNRRWAFGGAAAAAVIVATLVGMLGGGLLTVGNQGTVTSVVSSGSTLPDTTVSTGPTSTGGSSSTDITEPTTQTTNGTSTTDSTGTSTTGSTNSTSRTTTSVRPSTTQPTSPVTTGEQQYTSQQRISSAENAAAYLAQLVISGDTSAAGSLMAQGSQASLAKMVRLLHEPYDYTIKGAQEQTGDVVKVTLAVNDRIVNGQGELVETVETFFVQVLVDGASAIIVAINAGS